MHFPHLSSAQTFSKPYMCRQSDSPGKPQQTVHKAWHPQALTTPGPWIIRTTHHFTAWEDEEAWLRETKLLIQEHTQPVSRRPNFCLITQEVMCRACCWTRQDGKRQIPKRVKRTTFKLVLANHKLMRAQPQEIPMVKQQDLQ